MLSIRSRFRYYRRRRSRRRRRRRRRWEQGMLEGVLELQFHHQVV
jgi:hypothetical protein